MKFPNQELILQKLYKIKDNYISMEPDTALMLSKSETDGHAQEGSHAPVQEGYARTVREDGDAQEGKESIVKSYDYQVKQDIQEQSQRKPSQKKGSQKRIQGPPKTNTQQQVIANIQIETTNRDTDQLHDQSTVVPVSGLGTVEIARNATDRKETPEEKTDNAAVFTADPTFMVDQKGYKYFVGSKDRQQMKSRAGRDKFRVFGSSTQMSNHRDRSNYSNIASPKDSSQLQEASAGKRTPQNFEFVSSRKIFSNTQIGFTHGMGPQMPASANNFMLKSRGIGQYFVAKKGSVQSPDARYQQAPLEHLKSQNPVAFNCAFMAENPNYYFAGDQQSQETGPNRERLAARHDSLKSYSNSNHQSHVQSKTQVQESFRVTRKELTKVPGIHDSGSQHNFPSAGKLKNAGPNQIAAAEMSQRTHSQSNNQIKKAPGFDSFDSYKRDELGAPLAAPLIVVADPGGSGTFASPKFSLPESKATDKSRQAQAVSHGSRQSYEALFGQTSQQFAPQTKQVTGPGGFNSKIKKRTQSLMNYKHYLQNRCNDYQYNAVFPEGKPAEPAPQAGAYTAAKMPKNLSNDHHYKELQILKASGLVPPEKVTNTVRSGGSGVNTQRQTFPLGAQFKHLIDLQTPEGVMQSHMSNSQMQTLIHSQAKQQSGIDFSLQEIGEIKISNVPGASPRQVARVAQMQPGSQLAVGDPSQRPQGDYKVKRLTMNIQDLEVPEPDQGAAPPQLTVTTADNHQRSTVYSPDGNGAQPSPRTLKNSQANTPQRNKRRQVLLSNSRGLKKEYGQSIEDEEAPRVAGARDRKGKRRSPEVQGGARQLEPSTGSAGQGTARRRGKKQASLPKLGDSTNLQRASGSLVNIDQIISNADSQVSDNYVVVQGANLPAATSDLEAQIQNLKQLQSFKNAPITDPQVAKIDLNYLHQIEAQNRILPGQFAGASGRESFGANAAPTSSLHKQGALERDFLKNQKLMGKLNLSSNRAVTQITQREIDHLVEASTSYQGLSDPFELGAAIDSLGSRGKSKKLKGKMAVSSRFKDEDLEDWRRNIMTDKLYFLSTASKKSRQIMQQSMPDFKRKVGPRVDAGNQLLPRPFLYQIQTQQSETRSHAHKNCITPTIFSNEPSPIPSPRVGDSFFKKREKSRKFHRKNLIEANKMRFMKQGTRTNVRRSQSIFSQPPPTQPEGKEQPKPTQPPVHQKQQRCKSPRQVKVQQLARPKSPPRMSTTKNADAKDLAEVGFVENQKLGFKEILNQSRLQFQPTTYKNEEEEAQGVSLLTQDLNEYLDVDWSKVDVQLYDTKRATSKFGSIPGGMPEWADQEPEVASPILGGSPGLRTDRVRAKEEHLRQSMDEAKNMYRDVIRSYNKTLKTLQEEKEKQTIVIQSKGRNEAFKVNQCDWTTIVIEGVKNRPQPMRINFQGIKGEMICFISSIHKQPSELLNQGKYYNQTEMVFSTVPLSSLTEQNQPEATCPAGSARRPVSLVRFTSSCVYLSIETSLHSPSVTITTQFGLSPDHSCTAAAGNLSPKEAKVPRPLVSKETAKELKALLDNELQGFELIEQFIRKRFRSALEKHESLNKEVRKIIEDEMVASKYLRRVEQIKIDRIERKRNAQVSGKTSQMGDDDSSIQAPISNRNMVKENVEMVDNYAEFELNRKLHQLITYEMRAVQSKERREQYLKEFRDSAIAFLNRNAQMKEEKRILQAAEDKKNRQEKFFVRTLSLIALQKIVRKSADSFKAAKDAYLKFKRQDLMARRIQRHVRRQQARLSGADKTILPPCKNEIMYLSDWGYAVGRQIIRQRLSLATLAMSPQKKQAGAIIVDFLGEIERLRAQDDLIAMAKVKKHALRVYQMKKDQRETLRYHFEEQRKHLIKALEEMRKDPTMKQLPKAKEIGKHLEEMSAMARDQVLSYYNFATERAYAKEFTVWVEEINELKRQQKMDDRFGWRQPYLQNTYFRKKVKDLDGFFIREGQLKKRKIVESKLPKEEDELEDERPYPIVDFSHMLINVETEEDLWYTPPEDFDPDDENLTEAEKQELAQGKEIPFDLYIPPELFSYCDKLSKSIRAKKAKKKPIFKQTSFMYNSQNFHMREKEKKERLFALTQVDMDEKIDQQYLKEHKLRESEIRQAQQHKMDVESNRRQVEAMPHRFATYPERPRRRFIPEPKLMHQIIFKALQLHLTPDKLDALFSLKNGRRIELSSIHTSSIYASTVDNRGPEDEFGNPIDTSRTMAGGANIKE